MRGACRALGVEEPVTSPTFTIGQRYRAGERWVSHLDLYRLTGLDSEEDPALLEDYLAADSIAFVEWPRLAGARLDRVELEIRIRHGGRRLSENRAGIRIRVAPSRVRIERCSIGREISNRRRGKCRKLGD